MNKKVFIKLVKFFMLSCEFLFKSTLVMIFIYILALQIKYYNLNGFHIELFVVLSVSGSCFWVCKEIFNYMENNK